MNGFVEIFDKKYGSFPIIVSVFLKPKPKKKVQTAIKLEGEEGGGWPSWPGH